MYILCIVTNKYFKERKCHGIKLKHFLKVPYNLIFKKWNVLKFRNSMKRHGSKSKFQLCGKYLILLTIYNSELIKPNHITVIINKPTLFSFRHCFLLRVTFFRKIYLFLSIIIYGKYSSVELLAHYFWPYKKY